MNDFLVVELILMYVEGAVMAELAEELLGVKECDFRPGHVNNLANEFRCYTNYMTSVIHTTDSDS